MKSRILFLFAAFVLILANCAKENPNKQTDTKANFKLADQDCRIIENKSLRLENGTVGGEGKFLCSKALRTPRNRFVIQGTFERGGSFSLIAHSAKEDLSNGLRVAISIDNTGKVWTEVGSQKKQLSVTALPASFTLSISAHGNHTDIEVLSDVASGAADADFQQDGVTSGDFWGIAIQSPRSVTIRKAEVRPLSELEGGHRH